VKITEKNPTPKKMLPSPSIFLECHPISNLDDLDGVIQYPPSWVDRVEPLIPRARTVVQNILSDCHICHDYKGGYQADKYLHYSNEDILGNGYPFYNWAQIDIFVYFSHHLITIPPLCWINAGHNNGVKVLGTMCFYARFINKKYVFSPRFFFDSCDGIFLNYTWTEKHLINTVEAAKHRNLDVFVGIDVFGRNMFGGGKFHTCKAAEMVTRYNLSMAIFAPGWTHETTDQSDKFFEQFLNKDSAFWSSLWPYMYTHPISKYFTTNFYIGLDKKCYNIFNQQPQLSKFLHPREITIVPDHQNIHTLCNKCSCIQAVTVSSRNSCLITKENLRKSLEYIHHLFVCDLEIVDNTVIYFLTKNVDHSFVALTITILTCGVNNGFRKIKLLGARKDNPLNDASILEVNPSEATDVYDSIKNKYYKMVEEEPWVLRYVENKEN
ncbi:hypothetical protein NQ314_005458, partial [Rhamnusium bicolor]